MALGAMMVAGTAATATAASHIDFSGYYKAYQLNDTNLGKQAGDDSFTDSFFGHRLRLDLTFTPTDEIAVYTRFEGPNFARWGSGGDFNLQTRHVYGVIKQDWGTVVVGHVDDNLDMYGLASLGYAPGVGNWLTVGPYDDYNRQDAIRYSNKWDNGFGIMAQYAKAASGILGVDEDFGGGATNAMWSDGDTDRYQLEASYEWDGGGAALGFRYDREADPKSTQRMLNREAFEGWRILNPGAAVTVFEDAEANKIDNLGDQYEAWYINPAIMHSWGSFSVHAEAMFGWAHWDGRDTLLDGTRRRNSEDAGKGSSFYVDANYNYGPGNVTLAGWWASGTDFGDDDANDVVQIDEGIFAPLLVAYNPSVSGWGRVGDNSTWSDIATGGAVGDANNAYELYVAPSIFAANATFLNNNTPLPAVLMQNFADDNSNNGTSNHWALALTGVHAFTDDISMNYGIAYLSLVKPNYRVLDSASDIIASGGDIAQVTDIKVKNQDKDLGIELDLGFNFKLLDNLDFETQFGYMFNGDAYKTLKGYNQNVVDDTIKAVWEDPKDTYVWYNTLTFSF